MPGIVIIGLSNVSINFFNSLSISLICDCKNKIVCITCLNSKEIEGLLVPIDCLAKSRI